MNSIVIPIISVHRACQCISHYINKDEIIDLVNAYIKQNHLDVSLLDENDARFGWKMLCESIDEFPDSNKLDFIGQVLDARYITENYDYDFIDEFLNNYNYDEVQQEVFNQLAAFSSDAIKTQQIFSKRLKERHPKVLEQWNHSIDLFKGRYFSEAGNDIRKALEFLMRDILKNKKSLENQLTAPHHDELKSELAKYLVENKINNQNITFMLKIVASILYMSNEKFKHGEIDGLSEKDIRFYMNETYLVMQRLLDIEDMNS